MLSLQMTKSAKWSVGQTPAAWLSCRGPRADWWVWDKASEDLRSDRTWDFPLSWRGAVGILTRGARLQRPTTFLQRTTGWFSFLTKGHRTSSQRQQMRATPRQCDFRRGLFSGTSHLLPSGSALSSGLLLIPRVCFFPTFLSFHLKRSRRVQWFGM